MVVLRPPHPDTAHPAIARTSSAWRRWSGVHLEVAEFWCTGEILHALPFEENIRLSAVLEEVGGHCEPRFERSKRCPVEHSPRHMHVAPAGMRLWGYTAGIRYVRDATLVFDIASLEERVGETLSADALSTPRVRFSDDALAMLLGLLADAVVDVDPSTELYGDGLATAVVARLFAREQVGEPSTSSTKLAPWQLRRVVDYLEAHLAHPVTLQTLATSIGLSQRHFARAFKASTGKPPYRWHIERRIARAQSLLIETHGSLEDIAAATGFLDASHLGRVFRRHVGQTPGLWRRDHRR